MVIKFNGFANDLSSGTGLLQSVYGRYGGTEIEVGRERHNFDTIGMEW